jgi:hypothetical protein
MQCRLNATRVSGGASIQYHDPMNFNFILSRKTTNKREGVQFCASWLTNGGKFGNNSDTNDTQTKNTLNNHVRDILTISTSINPHT